jgi:hypothetical protein
MAETVSKSPGVSTREIDLSAPATTSPSGIPAGVIGTSLRGPAFVPVVVGSFQSFVTRFGPSDGEKFGPLAMAQWLSNARAGAFVKVLGVGNAQKRTNSGNNAGKVTNAGFVVGSQQVQSNGDLGTNANSFGLGTGRSYFLNAFMSESVGSTVFSSAGVQTSAKAIPIMRGVMFTPQGVQLSLSSSNMESHFNVLSASTVMTSIVGSATGTVNTSGGAQTFVLFLSGHKSSDAYNNVLTASFDPTAPNYFADVFNKDPKLTEKAGHLLYAAYDFYPNVATVSSTNLDQRGQTDNVNAGLIESVFLAKGTSYNSGTVSRPNYENFEDRFRTAFSPYFTSQNFGGKIYNLFRVHARDDGAYANTTFKISISDIASSADPTSEYGTFTLSVRQFDDTDANPIVIENFVGLSLNPNSQRYIGKMIGDLNTYYDFDRVAGAQKLTVEGNYPNVSNYIRVEIDDDVTNQEVPASSLPVGFRGHYHLVTSGSGITDATTINSASFFVQPPTPYRLNVSTGTGNSKTASSQIFWGVQSETVDQIADTNAGVGISNNVVTLTKYFPNFHTDFQNPWVGNNEGTLDANGVVFDADRFNRNRFTLERVQIIQNATTLLPDVNLWTSASYKRNGVLDSGYRFVNVESGDFGDLASRRYLKFTTLVQGGFDGLNVFDTEKSKMSTVAVKREMDYSSTQFGSAGPTVASYRKAIDILAEKSDVDIQLLAIPGIRNPGVTDYAIDAVEGRFDALYLMDIEEKDANDLVVSGSGAEPSVSLTATNLRNRRLDTSFAAAYYPDVIMTDPNVGTNVVVPPSVAVLGAFSLNDSLAYPWFAPAGFTRGALSSVSEIQVKLNRDNLDTLYSSNVNPIVTVPGTTGPVVYGQKTLLARASALDRVNVRRLLIEIRRRVRNVSNLIIFEPNREATLARFTALVDPILKQIQAQQGVERFKVKIDTSTTTQADVENNTIRGQIYLQPTRSLEFINLDFVVANQGAQI